jgi:hypothetical protein
MFNISGGPFYVEGESREYDCPTLTEVTARCGPMFEVSARRAGDKRIKGEEDIIALLNEKNLDKTGKPAEAELSKRYGNKKPDGYNAKAVKERVKALR